MSVVARIIRAALGLVDVAAYSGKSIDLSELAEKTEREVREAIAEEDVIHLAHFMDGRPLCWKMNQEGEFVADKSINNVTCMKCFRTLYVTELKG